MFELDRADRGPTRVTGVRIAHIKHKIRSIRARMKELSAIGELIKSARYKLREQIAEKMFLDNRTITISEVAEQTRIARAVLSNLVNKRGYNTLTDNLDRLCTYFGCELNDIDEYVKDVPREPERNPVSNAPMSPKPSSEETCSSQVEGEPGAVTSRSSSSGWGRRRWKSLRERSSRLCG